MSNGGGARQGKPRAQGTKTGRRGHQAEARRRGWRDNSYNSYNFYKSYKSYKCVITLWERPRRGRGLDCLIAIYYLLMCLFDEDATGEVVDGDDVEGCREA